MWRHRNCWQEQTDTEKTNINSCNLNCWISQGGKRLQTLPSPTFNCRQADGGPRVFLLGEQLLVAVENTALWDCMMQGDLYGRLGYLLSKFLPNWRAWESVTLDENKLSQFQHQEQPSDNILFSRYISGIYLLDSSNSRGNTTQRHANYPIKCPLEDKLPTSWDYRRNFLYFEMLTFSPPSLLPVIIP